MKYLIYFSVFAALLTGSFISVSAQSTVTGQLVSARDTSALYGATLLFRHFPDSSVFGTTADTSGRFEMKDLPDGGYSLLIRYPGMLPYSTRFRINGANKDFGLIVMAPDSTLLKTVVIKTEMVRVVQKDDTTEINAAAFKANPDATAEDLLAKMPGIQIENGQVKAQGENVQKVFIDGKEYFGDDPSGALKNMPADMVDKIQIYDQRSDASIFTGVDDGNTKKAINIVTKNQYSNATFGRVYAGYGTDEHYQAGWAVNDFRGDQKLTVLGNFNDINQVNFSQQDLAGVNGGGSGGGSGGRGQGMGRGGRGGDNGNFMVGRQNGITEVGALGINYANKFGKKLSVSGSYFLTKTDNFNYSETNRDYYSSETPLRYIQRNNTLNGNLGHRANGRVEYNPDSLNSFTFMPRFSWQQTDNTTDLNALNVSGTDSLNYAASRNYSLNESWNIAGSASYRRKFRKVGRTLTLDLSGNLTDRVGDGGLMSNNIWIESVSDSVSQIRQISGLKGISWSVNPSLTWTEQLGKTGVISFQYMPAYSLNTSDRETMNLDTLTSLFNKIDSALSSNFDNIVITQRGGVNYRFGSKGWNLSFGVDAMSTRIEGKNYFPQAFTTSAPFFNVLPSVTLSWKKGKKLNIRSHYRTSTNVPSVNQLQAIADNTNPLIISAGNPSLRQSYSHNLFARILVNNSDKVTSLFQMISVTLTNDYIVNSTFIADQDTTLPSGVMLGRGAQFTQPVNADGYINAMTFGNYSRPVKALKCNLNLTWGYTFNSMPGLVNGVRNVTNSHTMNGGIALSSNISEKIDFTAGWNMNYVMAFNRLNADADNSYYYHVPNAKVNWIIAGHFVINSEVQYSDYRGLSDGFNQNFLLWNAGLGYKFMKNNQCEFRLTAFDLLGQNASLTRTITETYFEDVSTNVLTRYVMLNFTWTIKKFREDKSKTDDQK